MQAFELFANKDSNFWAFIKFISEKLKYSDRKSKTVKVYSYKEIENLCKKNNISASEQLIQDACEYIQMRSDLLNDVVQNNLMNVEEAKAEFKSLEPIYKQNNYKCKLPSNKQKGDKKDVNFFTAIINILAESTIRNATHSSKLGFDDDPHSLTYNWDGNGNLLGASSRRFDGAYPSTENPYMVWEIKEYYYTTSFGSRVADAIYETQLDGHEFSDLYSQTGIKVFHLLFIDGYYNWWVKGKSYLCRLVDILNSGMVDEIIVGREVLERWPEILQEYIAE